MLKKIITVFSVLALVPLLVPNLQAQGIKAEYTERNGARAIGMGHAYTGVAEGLATVLWNPAGLVTINRPEVYFSRYEGFSYTVSDISGSETEDQISFNFFNFGIPVKEIGTFSFSVNLWDLGSSEVTSAGGGELRGLDDQSLMVLYGSFATHVSKKIDVGVSMKYFREKLDSRAGGTGTGAAVDLGMLYRPVTDIPLQIGFSLLDIGTKMQFDNENQSDRLPRRFRLGFGYNILKHMLDQDKFNLLLSTDYERFLVGNPANDAVFIGTEFSIQPVEELLLAMRSGYQSEEGDLNGALIGFGINYHGYSFDLARELGVNPLSDRTFFSVSAHF